MFLDSSSIVAVILREPGWEALQDRIDAAEIVAVGAETLPESHLVLTNRTERDASPILDALMREIGAQVIPFTEPHWRLAAEGFLRYGKGRHPARAEF